MGCDHLLHSRKKTDRCDVCDGKADSCIYKIRSFTEKIASKSTVAHSATEELVVILWLNTCAHPLNLFFQTTPFNKFLWGFCSVYFFYYLSTVDIFIACVAWRFLSNLTEGALGKRESRHKERQSCEKCSHSNFLNRQATQVNIFTFSPLNFKCTFRKGLGVKEVSAFTFARVMFDQATQQKQEHACAFATEPVNKHRGPDLCSRFWFPLLNPKRSK